MCAQGWKGGRKGGREEGERERWRKGRRKGGREGGRGKSTYMDAGFPLIDDFVPHPLNVRLDDLGHGQEAAWDPGEKAIHAGKV